MVFEEETIEFTKGLTETEEEIETLKEQGFTREEAIKIIEKTNVIEKLKNFKKAFFELNEEWKNLDCPRQEFDLSFKYPFKKSFDDLTIDVDNWVNTHIGGLKV